jgi:hypothetical protein
MVAKKRAGLEFSKPAQRVIYRQLVPLITVMVTMVAVILFAPVVI